MATNTVVTATILQNIGDTTLLELRNVVPPGHARVLVKLEGENPTGSMKDRMALAMVEAAEADGRLLNGGTVVEYTGGSTGVSLALVCAVKGYPLSIVTSDAFSQEKRDHMRLLGADLTLVASVGGGMTKELTLDMIEAARRIAEKPGSYWTDQLNNTDQIACYVELGDEIWTQTGGRVDAFVQSVGTGASVRGVAMALRRHNQNVHIVAVEPAESAVLSGGESKNFCAGIDLADIFPGGESGAHKIEGVGAGFVVPLWDGSLVDDIHTVSTEEAMAMSRRLAREEALFSGTSTGGNVVAALRVAKRLGPEAMVVTLMVDSGLKYLSTDQYKSA